MTYQSHMPQGHSAGNGEDPEDDPIHPGTSFPATGSNLQFFQGMHTADSGSFNTTHFLPGPSNIAFNATDVGQYPLSTYYLPSGQQLIGTGQQFHFQNYSRGYHQAQSDLPFYAAQPQPPQRRGSGDPLLAWKQVQEQHPGSAQNVAIFGASVADPHLPWSKNATVEANSADATHDLSSLLPVAPNPPSASVVSNSNKKGSKTCTTCSIGFDSAQHFRQHEKIIHGKRMFECACGHLDADKYNYCRHKHADDFSMDSGFSCKCGESDSTFADHTKHVTSCEEWKGRPGRPRGTRKWTSVLTHRHNADISTAT